MHIRGKVSVSFQKTKLLSVSVRIADICETHCGYCSHVTTAPLVLKGNAGSCATETKISTLAVSFYT